MDIGQDMQTKKIMEQQEWQKADKSEMSSYERMIAHNEWLKEIHKELKDKILKEKKVDQPEELIGGFDD